jgi:hypothetical protein
MSFPPRNDSTSLRLKWMMKANSINRQWKKKLKNQSDLDPNTDWHVSHTIYSLFNFKHQIPCLGEHNATVFCVP